MYIEYVLIENLIINLFIISCTQKILNSKSKLSFLGIILSTVIAVLCPLFNLNVLASTIVKLFTSIFLTTICFEIKSLKSAISSYICLLLITFLFGGATEMIKELFGEISVLSLLLCSFVVFALCKLAIRILKKKRIVDSFSTDVIIIDGKKEVKEKGYFDSGNLLYDPITQKPISLITHDVFEKLYGDTNILSLYVNKFDEKKLKNGHYITVNSAIKGGKILVFDVDKLVIENKDEKRVFEDITLGLSFSGFERAMHSQVLLHSSQSCF